MAPVWMLVHYGFKVLLVLQTFLTHSLTLQHIPSPFHLPTLPNPLLTPSSHLFSLLSQNFSLANQCSVCFSKRQYVCCKSREEALNTLQRERRGERECKIVRDCQKKMVVVRVVLVEGGGREQENTNEFGQGWSSGCTLVFF